MNINGGHSCKLTAPKAYRVGHQFSITDPMTWRWMLTQRINHGITMYRCQGPHSNCRTFAGLHIRVH